MSRVIVSLLLIWSLFLSDRAWAQLPPDLSQIQAQGILRVGLLAKDTPPFFFKNAAGSLEGLDIDIIKGLGKELGVEVTYERTFETFNDVVAAVIDNQVDLAVSKLSGTLPRAQKVLFSQPYVTMRQGLLLNLVELAKLGDTSLFPLQDLRGKFGVIAKSSYVNFARRNFPKTTLIELPSWDAVVEGVSNGSLLAAYRDELEVKRVVLTQPGKSIRLKTIALTDTSDPIVVIFPWNSRHLKFFVDQYLFVNNVNYSVDQLIKKYSDVFKATL